MSPSYSWVNQYFEHLCLACCDILLPDARLAYMSGITRLRTPVPDSPQGLDYIGTGDEPEEIIWEGEDQSCCIAVGWAPRCVHCTHFLNNYYIFCIAPQDCGCATCRPWLFPNGIIPLTDD